MKFVSRIDRVTLFPRGAEITRFADIDLGGGEQQIIVNDLPQTLKSHSLRVEGEADGTLELGAIDTRIVHLSQTDKSLDESERRRLEQEIENREDELHALEGRMETAKTQKKLMDNLAQMPISPNQQGGERDWSAVFDLIGARMPQAQERLDALAIERRQLRETIEDLKGQLMDEPVNYDDARTEVKISAHAAGNLKGRLVLRYQVREAGWQPLYDARLTTGEGEEDPAIELVRRAAIHQNTPESWEDVAITLSTTRPNAGTRAPDLASEILDILPDHPPVPMARAGVSHQMRSADETGSVPEVEDMVMAAAPMAKKLAAERETPVEKSAFQASFSVPGRVSLPASGGSKKVRLGTEKLQPRLEIRATPLIDPTAYLHAVIELSGALALLPGEVALYRDNVFVGTGHLPLVNVGETHELGFGIDDQVRIRRVELARAKGRHGLIKSENTDERHYKITINNHHKREMPIHILDRLPVAHHEKIGIEPLGEMSKATIEDVDDKRGVLAFKRDVAAGAEEEIHIHYKISWPRDERIG